MAEWVLFEADLGNSNSLSHAHFFRVGHCVNIEVQQDRLPEPVLSERPSLSFRGTAKFLLHTFLLAGEEKSVGKSL